MHACPICEANQELLEKWAAENWHDREILLVTERFAARIPRYAGHAILRHNRVPGGAAGMLIQAAYAPDQKLLNPGQYKVNEDRVSITVHETGETIPITDLTNHHTWTNMDLGAGKARLAEGVKRLIDRAADILPDDNLTRTLDI